jgi:RimJ/RimL family protein N-acetyltransferase
MRELETDRLILRAHSLEHVDAFVRWSVDPEVHDLSDDNPRPPSPEQAAAALERWITAPQDAVRRFVLCLRDGGAPIGFADIALIELEHARAMLGLVVGEKALWGRGYGREALAGLLHVSFAGLGLRRVGASIYATNARSMRLFEGAGFVREGVLREHVWKHGAALDEVQLGLLRREWEARR